GRRVREGHWRDELRDEAIAAFCLPELEVGQEWMGFPAGSQFLAMNNALTIYARGDESGRISVRRVEGDVELAQLVAKARITGFDGLKFSPDGKYLRASLEGRGGSCWDLDAQPPALVLEHDRWGFDFHPRAGLCAATFADGSIRIVELASGREQSRFPDLAQGQDLSLAWNPRFPRIALLSHSILRVLDIDTGEVLLSKPDEGKNFDHCDWHPE